MKVVEAGVRYIRGTSDEVKPLAHDEAVCEAHITKTRYSD